MNTNIPITSSVLHTTDFSEASHRAFAYALAIALLRQTPLTILNVRENRDEGVDWSSFPGVRETLERWALLEPGSERSAVFEQLKVDVRKLSLGNKNPIRTTIEFLERHPHDLVVLATEGLESDETWLRRSKAEAIARGADTMTLFVPSRSQRNFVSLESGDLDLRHILVPVDSTIDCTAATEFARRAAAIMGDGDVVITLLHIGEKMPLLPELAEGDRWTWQTQLLQGEPVESILGAMEDLSADLIVMTTNGQDTIRQPLLGSTTQRVIRKATCPVLAVPDGRYGAGS